MGSDPLNALKCFSEKKMGSDPLNASFARVHAEAGLLDARHRHRIDPQQWRPLIMSFRQFFGLTGAIHNSRLGISPEEMYAPWRREKGL
jgi:hypothetical protein